MLHQHPDPHSAAHGTFALWPEGAPGALGNSPEDFPTLTIYQPEGKPTGAGMVVCPGGGYQNLAPHEQEPVALWLASLGITAAVLRYRLAPRYDHATIPGDGFRGVSLMRENAGAWGLDPDRIGILGFSAGGHLAATVATSWDDRLSRPDLAVLVYPVTSMTEPFGHTGSRRNLLGMDPPAALEERDSPERRANAETPPCFLVHGVDDDVVPVENSIALAQALRRAGVPFEMHLYETGPHGFGLRSDDPAVSRWPDLCADWLRARGFAR